jgi:hypothetical protein
MKQLAQKPKTDYDEGKFASSHLRRHCLRNSAASRATQPYTASPSLGRLFTEMGKNILVPIGEGFRDALRLFLVLAIAPFNALSAFVRHDNMRKSPRDRARAH